jgi:ECF transporter S component (folate family)
MQKKLENQEKNRIFSSKYWKDATSQLGNIKMLTIAALIVALRVVVKFFKIPLAAGLSISFDAYVNSLGSLIYGPVMGLVVGAVSDILGCLLTGRMAEYFLPFILVEMASSFIFGLFFWKRKINVSRVLASKFTVNLICNIIMTSLFNKWMYYIYYGIEKAQAYNVINGARIVKNLIMFPLEAVIIVIVLSAALPVVSQIKLVDKNLCYVEKPSTAQLILQIVLFTAI